MSAASRPSEATVGAENLGKPDEGNEADCHTRDSSVVRVAIERHEAWRAPLAATGKEVALALRRAGFEARLDGPDHVILGRDGVAVAWLPVDGPIRAPTLRVLLRTIGVTPEELSRYLADQGELQDS
jgi:hypothetical protein